MNTTRPHSVAWALRREPKGALYVALLEYALTVCSEGLVLVREELAKTNEMQQFLEQLAPFRLAGNQTLPWMGAQLFDMKAEAIRFSFHREALTLLLSVAKSLYSWQQPYLPEDFCLFYPDGTDWLLSTSHTRTGFLVLTREEKAVLLNAIPKMSVVLGGA